LEESQPVKEWANRRVDSQKYTQYLTPTNLFDMKPHHQDIMRLRITPFLSLQRTLFLGQSTRITIARIIHQRGYRSKALPRQPSTQQGAPQTIMSFSAFDVVEQVDT